MFIQTEKTPNPETLKFIPGQDVTGGGIAEFKSIDEAVKSPLAQGLFRIEGVESVFLGRDFISVTKSGEQQWDLLSPRILAEIMDFYLSGRPVIEQEAIQKTAKDDESEIERQIRELIETRVQPAVAADGGFIEFVEFDDGIAYMRLQGACAGCPSSMVTLKAGIENMLKHYVPEVESVEAIPD